MTKIRLFVVVLIALGLTVMTMLHAGQDESRETGDQNYRERPQQERNQEEGNDSQRPQRRGGHPIVKALDKDRDGALSAEEIDNAAAALRTLDANGDGALSRDEMRPQRRGNDRQNNDRQNDDRGNRSNQRQDGENGG